jgi:DNA-binding winged helix-turn-helix (wHTH) protein
MPSEVIHFGDFELDPGSFELRRSGRVVRLERIPLELLLFLAEQRGQLVTRDEILERIWGKDVFVDADNSINTAVRKVRSALKEDPDNPRFLRTVPGKGYRFVADVSSITPRARIASASSLGVAPVGSVATTTGNVRRWAVQPTLDTASAPIEIPLSQESKMSGPVDQQETPRRKSLLKRGYVVAAPIQRKLVARRRLLLFPGRPRERSGHLGEAGAPIDLSQSRSGSLQSNLRAAPIQWSRPQQ